MKLLTVSSHVLLQCPRLRWHRGEAYVAHRNVRLRLTWFRRLRHRAVQRFRHKPAIFVDFTNRTCRTASIWANPPMLWLWWRDRLFFPGGWAIYSAFVDAERGHVAPCRIFLFDHLVFQAMPSVERLPEQADLGMGGYYLAVAIAAGGWTLCLEVCIATLCPRYAQVRVLWDCSWVENVWHQRLFCAFYLLGLLLPDSYGFGFCWHHYGRCLCWQHVLRRRGYVLAWEHQCSVDSLVAPQCVSLLGHSMYFFGHIVTACTDLVSL